MKRTALAAALLAALVASIALADNMGPLRDLNLTQLDAFCIYVSFNSNDSSLTPPKADVGNDLRDRAILYDVPLKSDCGDNGMRPPVVYVSFAVLPTAFSYSLRVFVDEPASAFIFPSVWEESGVISRGSGVTHKDIEDQARSLFDDFALAWKKEHKAAGQ